MCRIDFNGGTVNNLYAGTQLVKDADYNINVGNGRYIFDAANTVAQKHSGDNGNSSV